jgi:dUTP pyrophosphatase
MLYLIDSTIMEHLTISIKRTSDKFDDLPLPKYSTNGSAGMDVVAAIEHTMILEPNKIVIVPTGLSVSIPDGYELQVRSRSGLAAKNGIFCLNSPGTVDSDYRGEIGVILANFSDTPFTIRRGDRIAQLVVAKYEKVSWVLTEQLSDTERGEGGFGSTGI